MILQGDNRIVMQTLDPETYHCCITSPPYLWVRDYGVPPSEWPEVTYTPMTGCQPITVPEWTGCLGLEPTVEMFVAHIVLTMRDVWRLLRKDGTIWVNFGDSYYAKRSENGLSYQIKTGKSESYMLRSGGKLKYLKSKDLIGIPWRVAFALQADGWYLRSDIIWSKPNPMPESVNDRPTKAHEYIFLLSKSERYYYDSNAIKETVTASTISRLSQNVENQVGSDRANGGAKTNGTMKAVGKKQDDLGKRTYTGFNERYFGKSNSFARNVNESPKPGDKPQHRKSVV